jgi:hypothetical protein
MPTAVAIGGTAGAAGGSSLLAPAAISALGSLGSGLLGAWGSTNAANTQAQFGSQALAQLQSILGPVMAQGRGIVNSALGPLTKLLTPGPGQTAALSQLPGFQFAQTWGQNAVKNLGSTTGLGGNVLTAGANYATGLAQQGFSSLVGNLQNFLNSGLQTETSVGNALAAGTSSALQGIGQAKAAGALGTANALAGAAGGVGSSLGTYGLLSKLVQPQQGGTYGSQPGLNYDSEGNALLSPVFGP